MRPYTLRMNRTQYKYKVCLSLFPGVSFIHSDPFLSICDEHSLSREEIRTLKSLGVIESQVFPQICSLFDFEWTLWQFEARLEWQSHWNRFNHEDASGSVSGMPRAKTLFETYLERYGRYCWIKIRFFSRTTFPLIPFSVATLIIKCSGTHASRWKCTVLALVVFAFDRREPVFVGSFHSVFVSSSPGSTTDCSRVRDEEDYSLRLGRKEKGKRQGAKGKRVLKRAPRCLASVSRV